MVNWFWGGPGPLRRTPRPPSAKRRPSVGQWSTSLNPFSRFASGGNSGFQVLWEDGERVFCRGNGPGGDTTAVLAVLPANEHPAPAVLDRLAHEYELRDELDAAWAARPLEFLREQGQAILLLQDPGGEPLDRLVGPPMGLELFLRLAVALSVALGRLHGRGLVHKDIKPGNVLVDVSTGQVWLTGFGIASRLPRERQSPAPPEFLEGTLAYMAPEQTGRMNRSIDSRSDLYSLGVTLYQMLTGSLPFTASDPMEWVHCHIARKPLPPSERSKHIPVPVSDIIMKLLAKTAEERYQTAAGVENDLRHCLAELKLKGRIDPLALGEHDASDRLLLPERLYGRVREIETLLAAFDRVVNGGAPELVLVSGYSGIGKSSVVNELQPVLVPPRGFFASGKFDQYKRDIPYSTLAQAFQNLIRPLLGKGEADLAPWRDALRETLGPNAEVIGNLVPEVKLIIGEPPPVPELPPKDAQRRFQMVIRQFIGVFARPEHPLALFLDDLQWLDSATLDLLEHLLTQPDVRHLMLIGAYRDNEVNSAHPLVRKLEAIRKAGAIVHEIVLAPLTREDLGRLIGDALHCEPERVTALAGLIHEKTAGNPFFANQLISVLVEEGLLTFDYGRWSWDLNRIRAKGYTDNVVDLLVGKLNRLPVETQQALQLLACMGNSAEFALLEMASQRPTEEIHGQLWEAVRAGIIFRSEHSYTFLHDRVQEAAYSLIPEETRAAAHLQIGRLLTTHIAPKEREEAIFEIVNQFNRGVALIAARDEREQVAELNLLAGKRAKASSAHASALLYLASGAALLPEDAWERRQDLAFALQLHSADCEMCTGALQAAEERLAALATRAVGTVQRCNVAQRRVDLYAMLGRGERAVAVGLECLRHVGIDWSTHPTDEETRNEYQRFWSLLGSRAIEDIVNLPLMQDSEAQATIDMLTSLNVPAFLADLNLGALSMCRAANLNLEGGNSDAAAANYSSLAMMASCPFGDHHEGYRIGKMACDLLERRPLIHFGARTYYNFAVVVPWTQPLREAIDPARRAFQIAKERGDPAFAAYACHTLSSIFLALGHPLDQVEREVEHGMAFVRRFGFLLDRISASLALVRMLRGTTMQFGCLDDGQFSERSFEERAMGQPTDAFLQRYYWIRKLQARFFAGDYVSAIDAADKLDTLYARTASLSVLMLDKEEYHFYAALSRAAGCEPRGLDPYSKHREALERYEQELRAWAENCPQNSEDRAALVGAEIARIEQRPLDAMDLYQRAIASARANGFVHNEALANELAARFYTERGFEEVAHLYLKNARHGYLRWGASGKVRQLDQLHPRLRQDESAPGPTGTISAPVEHLDLATVLKVSQAVSGEIVQEKLLEILMRTAIEQAGAERGVLVLSRWTEPWIAAQAMTGDDGIVVQLHEQAMTAAVLPESVIQYVVHTKESVILDDAAAQNPFSADPYIRQHHARSILCMPLLNQAKLIGVLYLENNLTPRVFAPARISVLKLLASQAAIALENARLYREVAQREKQQTATAEMLRIISSTPIQSVLDAVAENAARLCDANNAEIFRLENNLLRLAASYGEIPVVIYAYQGVAVDRDTVTGRAACDRRIIHVHDLAAEEGEYPVGSRNAKREGHRTTLATPLLREGIPIGIILVRRMEVRPFSDEQIALIDTFADQAVIAFENARLFEAEKQRTLALARANRDLAEREAKIRRLVDSNVIGIFIWDFEGRFLEANDEFLRMVGYDREDLLAGSIRWTDLTPPDWRDRNNARMERGKGSGRFEPFEKEYTRKDGSRVPVLIGGATFEPGGNEGVAFVVDLTERERAEEALRESESKFRDYAETASDWLWEMGPDYKFTLLTENAFGSNPAQRIGTTCWDHALDLETEPGKWRLVWATLDAHESFRDFVYCTVDGSGAPMYVKASGKPVFDSSGQFIGYRGTGTDVTAIVRGQRAEASLQTVQAELAHVSRVMTLGHLTASIAHEVNQPIGSARNNARAALNFLDKNPPDLIEVREALGCIVADADRAGGIIDRIRDQIKKVPPRSDRFDLNQAIEEVIGLAQSTITENGVSVQSRLASGMAPVHGDRVQLQQVVLNLILNAVESMRSVEADQRELLIGTDQSEANGTLVAVRDSGPGIDPMHLERVFEAFYSTKSGMGMGLSICRSIIAAHGGRLWATATEPRGVVFQFTLPSAEAKTSIARTFTTLGSRKKTSL
jgi:PAS domain S-box-containing protein